jgi:hypothetical protein
MACPVTTGAPFDCPHDMENLIFLQQEKGEIMAEIDSTFQNDYSAGYIHQEGGEPFMIIL